MNQKLLKQAYQLLMPRHQALYIQLLGFKPRGRSRVNPEVYEFLPLLERVLDASEQVFKREKEMTARLAWINRRVEIVPNPSIDFLLDVASRFHKN